MTTRPALMILLVAVGVLLIGRSGGSEEPKCPETPVKHTAKKEGITLTCELVKEAASGGPYIITLTIRNETKRRIGFDEVGYLKGYEIKITDGNRKVVPYTRFGHKRLSGMLGRGKERWLKPGESSSLRVFNLARLFDLSENGTYQATITRRVHRDRRDGQPQRAEPVVIEINKLTLTLREPTRSDHAKWR